MTVLQALVLGIVQGITEFLPVSSSGHLVLLQKIFGIEGSAILFDTLVHAATLIAVCAVLWREIWDILKKLIQPLTLYLIIATIPAVIAALLFKNRIEDFFASASFLGLFFLITAALLFVAEIWSRQGKSKDLANKPEKKMNWLDALIIGIFQAVAIIPGISRSGATLSGGLIRGLKRDFAVRFAFLLSIPAIAGALILQVKDLGGGGLTAGIGTVPLIVGFVSAAVTGFFSIRLMLKIVREHSLTGFAIYTGALGLLVLIDQFGTHFFF